MYKWWGGENSNPEGLLFFWGGMEVEGRDNSKLSVGFGDKEIH